MTAERKRGARRCRKLIVKVYGDKRALGRAAAEHAAASIREAIREFGSARIIAATGTSQFEFLDALTTLPGISWQAVEMFHLDEYIGLPCTHPASFRSYLLDRLIHRVGIEKYHLLDGEGEVSEVIRRAGAELNARLVDVAFVGIGENGHLAFNDPPADFENEGAFVVVELDEACRRQQVGEGWFRDVAEVPRQAISMSVRQILKAREILAIVPDARKAQAVKACCEGAISPLAPGSVLRTHPNTTVFLDKDSAQHLRSQKGLQE
jgi:glucosamine-6-phosphate deaminase